MQRPRLRVLTLSEVFPNPMLPTFGVFVERQTTYLQRHCDLTVVAPVRVFPHLRLWKHVLRPRRFFAAWRKWREGLANIPNQLGQADTTVYYPRYSSPPRQIFHGVWGFFCYAFIRRTLHTLCRERTFDLLHAHYASPSGVIALLTKRWLRVPIVLSIHGEDLTYTARQNWLSRAVVRWVFRNVDMILANSRWTVQAIQRYEAKSAPIEIVRLGGNAEDRALMHAQNTRKARSPDTHNDVIRLLTVGYLIERKGHAYVLRAVKTLSEQGYTVRYSIVGDGPESTRLRQLAHQLGITDRVSFEGSKRHADVWPYFAECDVFVLPSWDEAFGVVYVEALGLGKPVIGCEGEGGPEDLSALGDCIALVKPRNDASLLQALKMLLDDPARRTRMGQTGRDIVARHFTWERNASDTLAIYRRVLERRSA